MAYTEFYCQSGGSNVNAGSTNNNTPTYQKLHGNWTQATGIFTVQDGTNPSSSVSVGQWGAIMVDGGTVAAYVGRITAVQNANNGTITLNTAGIGSKPANQSGTATITVGGAWQGPNGASGFPFTLTSYGANQDVNGNAVRTNLKNDQTYSITSSYSHGTSGTKNAIQGYTSSLNDHGRATIDGGTSTGAIIADVGSANTTFIDIIFKTSITSGTTDLVTCVRAASFIRCVFTGARRRAVLCGSSVELNLRECEIYDCNKSNTASVGLAEFNGGGSVIKTIFHDNPGSNVVAIRASSAYLTIASNVFSGTGKYAIQFLLTTTHGLFNIDQCDFYNNVSDAINVDSTSVSPVWIENCNFLKNGRGINNANSTTGFFGYVYNCGYGAGTMANTSADVLNNFIRDGTDVTYAADVTPWTDPDNGDFSINLAAAEGTGRGAFTTTASSYGPTVGYPDIGAAQALVTSSSAQHSFVFGG